MKQLEQGAHRNNGSVVTAKFVSDRKSSEIAEWKWKRIQLVNKSIDFPLPARHRILILLLNKQKIEDGFLIL